MAVIQTGFDIGSLRRGKVRDIYDLGDKILLVATDRISAFDVVLPTPIPDKGKVLTMMSRFWFEFFSSAIKTHIITTYASEIVWLYPGLREYEEDLTQRSMLVKKLKPLPVECIVRGYITGSGWKSYQKTGRVSAIELPGGLKESQKLSGPLFTPTTKTEEGHDEEISFAQVESMIGKELAGLVRDKSIELYSKARDYAFSRGIIIADTKFEFGLDENGQLYLIDEALTPDSSRFWKVDEYQEGRPQKSYDKQYIRDYLNTLDWDKTPPGPQLPDEIVNASRDKYIEILRRLTGERGVC